VNNALVKFELNLKISRTWMRRGYSTLTERKLVHHFSALANTYDEDILVFFYSQFKKA